MDASFKAPFDVQETQSSPSLTVTVVRTETELDGMEAGWKELVDKSDSTVYQSFEWVRTWWKYFRGRRELYCIVCMEDERVVGILPMFREKTSFLGLRVATSLKFIGSGISDYLEPIILPGYEEAFLRVVVDHLGHARKIWDIFEISDVSDSTPISRELMERFRKSGLGVFSYKGSLSSQVSLPSTWEELLQQLGRHTRHELKRKTQKLMENQEFEVETFGKNADDAEMVVKEMAALHGERWRSLGYGSALDDETNLAFHTELAKKFADRGWLKVYFLKINGTRVAVSYDFFFHKRVYVYQCNAHGPADVMRYSPGYVLHYFVIKQAIEDGMDIYDMLRGSETYKTTDFKSVRTGNWLVRTVFPMPSSMLRFKAFVLFELLKKIPRRLDAEYHGFKRFVITQKPSFPMMVKFLGSKFKGLWNLLGSYFSRFFSKSHSEPEDIE